MEKYEDTIKKVKELLANDQEWNSRYAGYIDTILSNKSEKIKKCKKKI